MIRETLLFTLVVLFVTLPTARSSLWGPRNVKAIRDLNQCLCSCTPVERKVYISPMGQESNWFGAVSFCQRIGMEIAEVLNKEDEVALNEMLDDDGDEGKFYWIGANDLGQQGTQRWALTGRPVDYANWDEGEPNNSQGEDGQDVPERCAAVGKDKYKWNDFQCTRRKPFICQKFVTE